MKNSQKKNILKSKQENYYQSQYYKKMLNKKEYSNWIKEKIIHQSKANNNKNEKSKLKNFTIMPIKANNLKNSMAINKNRKTNIHNSMDAKNINKQKNLFDRKFTNINNKNSAYETFSWMKKKNNKDKDMNLSKSMSSYKRLKNENNNNLGAQEIKDIKKNNNIIAQSLNYIQNNNNRNNNYKNRAINNNYRFIINNNYYNKNNKNQNRLSAESHHLFIEKENKTNKKGNKNLSAPHSGSEKEKNNLEILHLEKKIKTIRDKIDKLNFKNKLLEDNPKKKLEIEDGDLIIEEKDLGNLKNDIYDVINEIQNNGNKSKKKGMGDHELIKLVDNMINRLYNKNNKNDMKKNNEEMKKIVDILNSMSQQNKNRAIDILKEKADDDNKKQQFNELQKKILKDEGLKNFISNIIKKANEEEKNLDNVVDNIIEELRTENTLETQEYNNKEDKDYNKGEKIDKVVNKLKNMEKNDQKEIFEKLKKNAKNSGEIDKIQNVFNILKSFNKMKEYAQNIRNKLQKKNDDNKENNNIDDLESNKVRRILEGFEKDLFDEENIPLTKKEIKENEIENNKKISLISKIIDNLNKKDKEQILQRLKIKADNQYKKSQLEKLIKVIKSIHNVKSYFVKYIKKEDNNNNINENINDIGNELENIIKTVINDLFNNNDNKEEETIQNLSKIINGFKQTQQMIIFKEIQKKSNSDQKKEKLKKLEKEVKVLNKLEIFSKAFSMDKYRIIDIKNKKELEDKNKKDDIIELNDNEIINLVEAILNNIFNPNKDKKKDNLYLSEADKYLLKNEKEKNIDNTVKVLKTLKRKDSEKISKILKYILNDDQIKELRELNKKIGIIDIDNDKNINNIINDFNKDDEAEELKDEKLVELTNKFAESLMKEYSKEEKNKQIDSLNEAANSIALLNKNDQEKILDALKDFSKNERQKEILSKLIKLVDNLNYMKFYLYSLGENIIDKTAKKDLKKEDFQKLKKKVMSKIFEDDEFNLDFTNSNEDNIEKISLMLNNLSIKNRNIILEEIREKAKEYGNNDNVKKTIEKLNENLQKYKISNLFLNLIDKKENNEEKKQLNDNQIQQLVDKINEALFDKNNSNNNNYTEQLLINKHKEEKIKKFVSTINGFNKDSQKKALKFLSKSRFGSKKVEFDKLKSSIMKAEKSGKLINSVIYWKNNLGRLELNEVELNVLVDTFFKDLFNEEIQDEDIKEDNLNLIANIIKELHIENQNKVMEIIEKRNMAEEKKELIENLRERILKLRLLKDELEEEKMDEPIEEEKKEDSDFDFNDLIEETEDSDDTLTVEISIEDMGKEDLDLICKVFKAEIINDKEKKEKEQEEKKKKRFASTKSVNILANSIVRLDRERQNKIKDKLEKNAKNEVKKEQLKLLMDKVKELDIFQKISREIKQRKKKQIEIVEKEIEAIKKNKTLDKEYSEKLEKEIVDNLYNKEYLKFDKNEGIRRYLLEAHNEIKIKNIGEKVSVLSAEDRKILLNKAESLADNEEKKSQFKKLNKLIDDLVKMREINERAKEKENNSNEELLPKDKLENFANNCIDSLFKENSETTTKEIAKKISGLSQNNQDYIIKNLKEKNDNEEKNEKVDKVVNYIGKKSNLKKFKNKVKNKHVKIKEIEKIENEKKYGIFVIPEENNNENSKSVLIKKPNELLNEDKLNEIQKAFIEELEKIKEEEEQNDNQLSDVDKYLKKKEDEQKIEEIIDVINTLVNSDKNKILDNIRKNFDKPNNNNLFIKFMRIFKKREKIFENEKRKRQEKVLEEIREENNEK